MIMTELEMLKHLLKRTGRVYDEHTDINGTIIQIHVGTIRYEFDFDSNGAVMEDWDNSSVTTWLTGGAYYD